MVQNANCATSENRNRKAPPRPGSPAPSNSSAGSASSRASTPTRTVRFQDQEESRSASGRGRWQDNQPPSGNRDNQRQWAGQRPQGQRSPSPRPPLHNQSGPRPVPPQSERRWAAGQGTMALCVPRLHPTQGIGGRVGDHLLAVVISCHQLSRRVRPHRDAGCLLRVVLSVENSAVIVGFIHAMLNGHKHHRVCNVMCVVVGGAIQTVTRLEICRRVPAPRDRHPTHRRDQHPSLPINSQTGSGARLRANESRRHLHALSQIRCSLCLRGDTDCPVDRGERPACC